MAPIITYIDTTESDFDGNPDQIRIYTATINGKQIGENYIVPQTADDVIVRQEFLDRLIALGYVTA